MINRLLIIFMLIGTALAMKAQDTASLVIYPNPFCEDVNVRFNIPADDTVIIKVFSMWGQEMGDISMNEKFTSGEHTVTFSPDSLLDGMYIFRFQYSDSLFITLRVAKADNCNPTGIALPAINNPSFYPNPTDRFLTIPIQGYKQIIITNLQGQVCKQLGTEEDIIDIADLAAGVYAVNVFDKDKKLVVSERIKKE